MGDAAVKPSDLMTADAVRREPLKMARTNMTKATRGRLVFFQFDRLAGFSELTHRVFSRKGGISQVPFDRLNVAFSVGDRRTAVLENRQLVADALDCASVAYANQVHGTRVLVFSGRDCADIPVASPRTGDALVSDIPGLALAIQVADCQALLLYDPVRRVVANVHAGWRGSVQNIVGKTVAVMHSRFGCRGADIVAAIAPSLGPCCAEFINYRTELPNKFWHYQTKDRYFDFWQISRDQLEKAGLQPANIHIGGLCTRCRTDYFYSYRGEARKTGRFVAVIGLRRPETNNPDTD